MIDKKNIAVTHDWLLEYAGAERVLEQILKVTGKDTSVFTNVVDVNELPFLKGHDVTESFISRLPFGRTHYRKFLPLMPFAVEQWNMNPYDLVVSSSYAVAKGFISHPDQLHISYVHSPIRYAWDMQHQYLEEANMNSGIKGWITKYLLHRIRKWDVNTANQVDYFIANSKFIQRRIKTVYRRDSTVIYPSVDVEGFKLQKDKEDYYVTVSRLVPYKKTSLIIRAFNQMPDKKLYVIGGGPDLEEMRKLANENVEVLGYVEQSEMVSYVQNARAFVYAAKEDFGIIPLEAQACGTPVIAYGKGGLAETVIPLKEGNNKATGILYDEQNEDQLIESVKEFERKEHEFDAEFIRQHAEFFGSERFRTELASFIEEKWDAFSRSLRI